MKTKVLNIESMYTKEELKELFSIEGTTRKLTDEFEYSVNPNHLCQPIDIDIFLDGKNNKEMHNMIDYPFRSLESSVDYIKELKEDGVNSVLLHLVGDPNGLSPHEVLVQQIETLKAIRKEFSNDDLNITVDPFGVAFHKDGTWGMKDTAGNYDYHQTLELLSEIAYGYNEAGVDAVITLGRIEAEVDVVKRTLNEINSPMLIKSFSQNPETATAYVYFKDFPDKQHYRQKVLVGNITEMMLRTIIDIWEGADTVILKPIESFHLATLTIQYMNDKNKVTEFLNSIEVAQLISSHVVVQAKVKNILENIDQFHEKGRNVKIGGYSVSGTYFIQKSIQEKRGDKAAFSLIHELYLNTISVCGQYFDNIMDRNIHWYLQNKERLS